VCPAFEEQQLAPADATILTHEIVLDATTVSDDGQHCRVEVDRPVTRDRHVHLEKTHADTSVRALASEAEWGVQLSQ